jgi:hypothetical protein
LSTPVSHFQARAGFLLQPRLERGMLLTIKISAEMPDFTKGYEMAEPQIES